MHKKGWFYLSLGFNILIVLFLTGKRIYYSGYFQEQSVSGIDIYNNGRVDVQKNLPITKEDIVFFGNSITQGYPVSEVFNSLKVKNRGIGSNRLEHALGRVSSIASSHPRAIFIEFGINDIAYPVPEDVIYDRYSRLIVKIKTISPATIIYVQSVFPVYGQNAKYGPEVKHLNMRLNHLSDSLNTEYLDIYQKMANDSTLFYDGIHPNGAGYRVWSNFISKKVDSLLNIPYLK